MSLQKKRALTILSGWLEAARISFRISGPDSLIIEGPDREFKVQITNGPTSDTAICATDLTGPAAEAMEAFWAITEKTGFGRPTVIDRGEAPESVRFSDDPELVAMRHREFRQVANLPSHIYKDPNYQKIISWYCINFFRNNHQLCRDTGYEIDDIKTYAWLYLTNFYGRWRHMDSVEGHEDKRVYGNRKMFCSYLQQRLYSDLKPLLVRKSRSIVIDKESAELGTNVEYCDQFPDQDGPPVPVPVSLPQEADPEALLDAMSHDSLMELLQRAVDRNIHGADKKLQEHKADCQDCSPQAICDEEDLSAFEEQALEA